MAPPREAPPITILGVPLDNVTTNQTVDIIEEMIASGNPHFIATANVDFIVQAKKDVELRRILFDAHLVVCDGMPLVWASKFLGNPLPERVAGSDLVPLLLNIAEEKGYRVFFLGGRDDVAEAAVAKLREEKPNLNIVGRYSPPLATLLEMDHSETLARIHEAKPDLLFVSFGCPKQEKWLYMNWRDANVPVGIGVGATIDFIAGHVKRAPVWMQKIGAEWIYRLGQEPKRLFKRYMLDLWIFLPAILVQKVKLTKRQPKYSAIADTEPTITADTAEGHWIQLPERFDAVTLQSWSHLTLDDCQSGEIIKVDASKVTFIDSSGIGKLVQLSKNCRNKDMQLVVHKPTKPLLQALDLMKMRQFFKLEPDIAPSNSQTIDSAQLAEKVASEPEASSTDADELKLSGEITAVNASKVWGTAKGRIDEIPPKQILPIDLAEVSFIDSSGIGAMIKIKKHAAREGKNVAYINPSEDVLNVIELTGMREYLMGA